MHERCDSLVPYGCARIIRVAARQQTIISSQAVLHLRVHTKYSYSRQAWELGRRQRSDACEEELYFVSPLCRANLVRTQRVSLWEIIKCTLLWLRTEVLKAGVYPSTVSSQLLTDMIQAHATHFPTIHSTIYVPNYDQNDRHEQRRGSMA